MPPRARKATDPLADLPVWAQKLAQAYYTKTVSTFLLHGAVRDLQPLGPEDARTYGPLKQFLTDELFGGRNHVLYYDRSSGIRAATPESQKDFTRTLSAYDTMYGTDYAKVMPRDPGRALQILENFLRMRLSEGQSLALIIDFAETLVPGGEMGGLSAEDRFSLATLVKWASDPQFLAGDLSIVLLVENLAEISGRISRNPYVAAIELPLPTEDERLKEKKKDIIQAECHGLLEFIEPAHTLDSVAGHARAKEMLRQAASALKKGRIEVLPMGYLISGPVGTGKTFLATCFAGDIGIPCVKFLNFRSQWQGVTEANLEKIFNLLKALWPVAVMVDEADAFLGNREASGDSGTSSRVFASIASFMGNTEYRGKIVWFLLTARPDLLPVDLKRQGRAEEHLALFYPQTDAERDDLAKVVARKVKVKLELPSFAALLPKNSSLSGADIEAVLVRSKFRALAEGREEPTEADVRAVVADFVPPSYPMEIELQNLAAVQECTSRELLPQAYRTMERDDITRRIRELKLLLEER